MLPHYDSPSRADTDTGTDTTYYDPADKKTLALLFPPGMIGGYRNQVLRFVAFVAYAQKNNITQLFLPSLVWSTQYEASGHFYPVPMDLLFDVELWNSFKDLPNLVETISNSDCWKDDTTGDNTNNEFYQALIINSNANANTSSKFVPPLAKTMLQHTPFLTPVVNISRAVASGQLQIKPRKLDLLPQVENCTHPIVYGGGTGAGRLWNDFLAMPKLQPGTNATKNIVAAQQTTNLISLISKALQPRKDWQEVAKQCIQQSAASPTPTSSTTATKTTTSSSSSPSSYLALHARIEVDMMIHKCGKHMEKNLTKIFHMVDDFVLQHSNNHNNKKHPPIQGVFVAVSRTGMLEPTKNVKVNQTAHDNYKMLLSRSVSSSTSSSTTATTAATHALTRNTTHSSDRQPSVFECGEVWMDTWYAKQQPQLHHSSSQQQQQKQNVYGSILPSLINFYVATQAQVFVGVSKSSWSTDVWTTRYYQGKGDGNYQYTPDGIKQLNHGGLAPPHKNC
jgi:hypothetical protein